MIYIWRALGRRASMIIERYVARAYRNMCAPRSAVRNIGRRVYIYAQGFPGPRDAARLAVSSGFKRGFSEGSPVPL